MNISLALIGFYLIDLGSFRIKGFWLGDEKERGREKEVWFAVLLSKGFWGGNLAGFFVFCFGYQGENFKTRG